MKYYHESIGKVVNQVYEIEANSFEEAKMAAFADMKEGDGIAECPASAVIKDGDYASIDREKCERYATLKKGTWATTEEGSEYWESRAWYFSDNEEACYNSGGEEFDDWE
jgi:hypothetical protein